MMKVIESVIAALKKRYVCNHCLGRICGNLLSGYTNEQRGEIIRRFIAFLVDSGEKIDIDLSNLHGIKFRNVKLDIKAPEKCSICKDFFYGKIDELAKDIVRKLDCIEFNTFQIGSVLSDDLSKAEEKLWEDTGTEFTETIKSEINRELGKRIEKLTDKEFSLKNPDVAVVVDLKNNTTKIQIRSLYIFGKYKKLVRNIPQAKWVCLRCSGKGCEYCKGEGKLYPTSVQEIIEKPLLKATGSKKSKFSASGREDVDARCLDWRQFIVELVKPLRRKIDLKQIEKEINKSKKVKVRDLKFTTKDMIRQIKTERIDKTYLAEITFEKPIDKKKLKELISMTKGPILQRTPMRVVHRRADKFRKRAVKKISWKLLGRKTLRLKVAAESGLYIKELITGDEGRTKPNVSDLLGNRVKKISLDVIKIHTK